MKEFQIKNQHGADSFVAILRGIDTKNCIAIAEVIYKLGIKLIELPINLDKSIAFRCVEKLGKTFPDKKIGIGTALTTEDVIGGSNAGASFIVSPNFNPKVVEKTKQLNLFSVPGILTPSEAFNALEKGADALKIFPISAFQPSTISSLMGVLPSKTLVMPTGNVTPQEAKKYFQTGISKIGLGSVIYKKGDTAEMVKQKLQNFLQMAT